MAIFLNEVDKQVLTILMSRGTVQDADSTTYTIDSIEPPYIEDGELIIHVSEF